MLICLFENINKRYELIIGNISCYVVQGCMCAELFSIDLSVKTYQQPHVLKLFNSYYSGPKLASSYRHWLRKISV